MLGPFEITEIVALGVLLAALVVMTRVRAHPANTPRTRLWWGRFLALLGLETVSQLGTNLEQLFPVDARAYAALNLIEHLFAAAAGLMALVIAYHALLEAVTRQAAEGEGA